MVAVEDRRRSPRIRNPIKVKLFMENETPVVVQAQDFSEIGLYLIYEHEMAPEINSLIKLQVQGVIDAQIVDAKVIRVAQGQGFAVEFII